MSTPSKLLIFGNILSFIQPHLPETPIEEWEFTPKLIEKISEYHTHGYAFAIASNLDEIVLPHQSEIDARKYLAILMQKISSMEKMSELFHFTVQARGELFLL